MSFTSRSATSAVLVGLLFIHGSSGVRGQTVGALKPDTPGRKASPTAEVIKHDKRDIPIVTTVAEAELLLDEVPLTVESWPTWRRWLISWIGKRNPGTEQLKRASRRFHLEQVDADGELRAPLNGDALSWYLLGSAYLYGEADPNMEPSDCAMAAEPALRRSIELNPRFSRAYRNLGLAYLSMSGGANDLIRQLGEEQLDKAHRLNPKLPLAGVRAQAAAANKNWDRAIRYYQQAMEEEPELAEDYAIALAEVYVMRGTAPETPEAEKVAASLDRLAEQFPQAGRLACYNGLVLLTLGNTSAAAAELKRADQLGEPVEDVFSPEMARQLRLATKPSDWWLKALLVTGGVSLFYIGVVVAMVLAAFWLARCTRGTDALKLMASDEDAVIVQNGQVMRTRSETWLSRVYLFALTSGLALFYLSIPFIIVGILCGTAAALYGLFQLPRIPVKLIILIPAVGLGMAYGIIKSLFARPTENPNGVYKNSNDEPHLHALTEEVARQVNTVPVDQIYLTPGSEIGVYQVGRGPFGILGVKRRVLMLGLASLQFLSIAELRAILAHEYAHFSHGDTFISRWVHQLSLTIQSSLQAMAAAGGAVNYINPFFWFLVLYYKAYNMMSSGFSRSREFLADRMAVSLYGANIFSTALCKVVMHGTFYDVQLNDYIANRLSSSQSGESFALPAGGLGRASNFYASSRKSEQESRNDPKRLEQVKELLSEKASLFATHPTVHERLEAIAGFANHEDTEMVSARSLLLDADKVEIQLTKFVQGHVDELGRLAVAS